MLLRRLILTTFALVPCALSQNTTERGEGGEVIVSNGIIVRDVASETAGELPLVAVGTAAGIHHLYDPNTASMRGFWRGRFGRESDSGHFMPELQSLKSFALERPPWTYGERPRVRLKPRWQGTEIRDGQLWLLYQLIDEKSDMRWEIRETLEFVSDQVQRLRFHITPNKPTDLYLNYWLRQTEFRSVVTDGQQNQRNLLKNLHLNQTDFSITFQRKKETPTVPHGYTIESIALPSPKLPFRFEPTNIDFAPDGSTYVSTRTGAVWRRFEDQWTRFADGLHEINGIRVAPDGDGVYVMQKPELTLLRDANGDGVADVYKTIEDRFRFTGHYHEFAYGPRINSSGDLFFSTGLASSGYHTANGKTQNQMTSALGYRGWVMQHKADGTLVPFASGLRSPAGIGINAQDELFITDNQGDWVASSYLGHVEKGDFLGHPASLWDKPEYGLTPKVLDYTNNAKVPESVPPLDKAEFSQFRKRPAVWLSHGDLTNSPGHPSFAPETGFGPFAGQAFIADIAHRNIVRVALEKIDGTYQGAVFPFIRPLQSAAYSTAFDPEGNLWVGSVGRGWTAGDPAIEIIRHAPQAQPFEMHRITLTKHGFDVVFTQALASTTSLAANEVSVKAFQYNYWDVYGSEHINTAKVTPSKLTLSSDRTVLSVHLPLKAAFVYELQLPELQSASGVTLENTYGIYTLNKLLP